MGVEAKTCTYNEAWNTIDVFKPSVFKSFKDYAINDSICLLKALRKAQQLYYTNYSIDFALEYSCASRH